MIRLIRGGVRLVLEVGYVLAVAVLTLVATADPNEFRPRLWVVALVLCLPTLIVMLPALYLLAAAAWNATGADDGGTTWPVTATYVLVLTVIAIVNVLFLRWLANARRRRRAAVSPVAVIAAPPQRNT